MKSKGTYLGEFEELVLLSVASLSDSAYGVSVIKFIEKETRRSVNISAVHEVLKRLERKGFVKSRMGGATAERGGRRKRFFAITAIGRKTLEAAMSMRVQLYKRVLELNPKAI